MPPARLPLGWVAAAIGAVAPAAGLCAQGALPPPRVRLLDLNITGQSALSPYLDSQSFTVAGSMVYFPAWSFAEGYELWRTDGTAAGTVLVGDLMLGTLSSGPGQLISVGDRLCFVATDASGLPQIFVDDAGVGSGSSLTLRRLTSFGLDDNIFPGLIGAAGDQLVFTGPLDDQVGLWSVSVRPIGGGPPPAPVLLGRFAGGPVGAGFGGSDAAAIGPYLYFAADDGASGRELWRTDGRPSGTALVADLAPGPAGSDPDSLVNLGGRVFLAASTPETGREPWVCDDNGARALGDLHSAAAASSSMPEGFTLLGSRVIFAATDPLRGRELWSTSLDGHAATTEPLAEISPGPSDGIAMPFRPARIGGNLYFAGRNPASGTELWRTDGTAAGTVQHGDLRPGPTGSEPTRLMESAGRLVFQAVTDESGYRLWVAEPSSSGPLIAPRRLSGVAFSDDDTINRTTPRPCAHLPALGGVLVFPGFRQATGIELLRMPASGGYAELVRDIRPGSLGSSPTQLARLGRGVIFSARNELGSEPWISTGDPAMTRPLADLSPGRTGSNPGPFLVAGANEPSAAIFRAFSTAGSSAQWYQASGDPAQPTVRPVGISEAQQSISPRSCQLDGVAIVAARQAAVGDEPFVFSTDSASTPVEPALLVDIMPGPGSSSPFFFARVESSALFFAMATSGPNGASVELWRAEATPGSARRVARITNPTGSRVISTAARPVTIGSCMFFVADDGSGDELWVSRVDIGETFRVADIEPGSRSSFPSNLCAARRVDGRPQLFFTAQRADVGVELWLATIADRTVDTAMVIDLAPGPVSSGPVPLMTPRDAAGQPLPGGAVYFTAADGRSGRQLWSSDGTADGTRVRTSFAWQSGVAVQSVLGVVQRETPAAYIRVLDPTSSTAGGTSLLGALYRTDDSPSGASIIVNTAGEPVAPGSALLEVNNRLFLSVTDRLAGAELGVLDLCPADFDNSGLLSVSDLFGFLAAWLPSYGDTTSAAADVSFNGRVDMQDLFVFLDVYFRGCP